MLDQGYIYIVKEEEVEGGADDNEVHQYSLFDSKGFQHRAALKGGLTVKMIAKELVLVPGDPKRSLK